MKSIILLAAMILISCNEQKSSSKKTPTVVKPIPAIDVTKVAELERRIDEVEVLLDETTIDMQRTIDELVGINTELSEGIEEELLESINSVEKKVKKAKENVDNVKEIEENVKEIETIIKVVSDNINNLNEVCKYKEKKKFIKIKCKIEKD